MDLSMEAIVNLNLYGWYCYLIWQDKDDPYYIILNVGVYQGH